MQYGLQNQRRLHRLRHLRRCLPGGCHFGRRRQVCDRCGRVPGLRHLRRRVPRKRNQRRLTLHTKKENGRVRFCAPASFFPQSTIHAGGWAPARVAKLTLWAFGRHRRARRLKTAQNKRKCLCFADMEDMIDDIFLPKAGALRPCFGGKVLRQSVFRMAAPWVPAARAARLRRPGKGMAKDRGQQEARFLWREFYIWWQRPSAIWMI